MAVTCLRSAGPDSVGGNFCTESDAPLPLTGEEGYYSIFGWNEIWGWILVG